MVVFIQNDREVPPGGYGERLAEKGLEFTTVRVYLHEEIPPLDETSAVIVLGGSMCVHDTVKHSFLVNVKDYIRIVLTAGKPYLGICLGGQLLADVAGAKVSSNLHGEIGMRTVTLGSKGLEDTLFRSVSKQFVTFQWHNDSFAIPEGAIHLAGSDVCPNQAFRCGENAYGLQFHPEVNERIVNGWCNEFDSGNLATGQIMAGFKHGEDSYRETSLTILHNFLDIAGIRR